MIQIWNLLAVLLKEDYNNPDTENYIGNRVEYVQFNKKIVTTWVSFHLYLKRFAPSGGGEKGS